MDSLGGITPPVKITLWLYFASTLAVCLLLSLYLMSLHECLRGALYGKPLPSLSESVIGARFYLPFLPLLWLGAAVWLSRPSAPSAASISIYGASVLLLCIVLFSLALIATALPFVPLKSLHAA